MANKFTPNQWDATQHYKNDSVARKYDEVRFSSLAGKVFNASEKRIVSSCFEDLPKDTVILDIPCGTGRLAEALLRAGFKVHGADISPQMLAVSNERLSHYGERFSTEEMDAFTLKGIEKKFEATLCARVLMHFPFDMQIEFLRGIASVTTKRIVINHSLCSPYQRFRRRFKKLLGHQRSANHPISDSQIKHMLAAVGFVEVRRKRINSFISEAIYIVAERTH